MVESMVVRYVIVNKENEIVSSFQTLGGEHSIKAPEGCRIIRESEYVPTEKTIWQKIFGS